MYKVGIDLGGTKIEVILLDENLCVLERKRIPTPQNDYEEIINNISSLVLEVSENIADFSIGVCTPGAISKQTGLIKNSNTQCLIGNSLKQDLEKKLGKKISIENDANCFTMAEARMGAAMDYGLVFGVIMGTGVGGGIVINGNLHSGRTNIAGEWGHHILHRNGNSCYCGKDGCVETYVSGPSLEKQWKKQTGKSMSLPEILSNIDNKVGQKWKDEFLENFGYGLANVIDILDPDAIVLGGGLSNIDFLYTEGKKSVYDKVFSDLVDTPILKNKLGDSAGVYGAALLT
ncbi:MAG: ROK family protein [Nitrosopumilus sp.]|uniref:ROK family protein n=1 Tax=Nitrosopumilus sp. TaxID=2024843 RepID=UPI00243176B2|nr:ROK family protein [Nitrosopumilus sp.]MCV0365906.1 ROK family protein [Nitrosopumilus sp.]